MAVYQLGALVTKIKGSIGGTTFKTQRTTNVVMRKSYGYGRSKLLSNAALQYARYIFTKWSFLTPEEQSSWQNTAALVFFPDKFGNQVHITGRQLFTKININLQKENYYASVPEGFTMNVPVLDVENALLNPVAKYASLGVEFFDNATGYVIISAEVSINNLQSAVFSRRFALTRSLTTGAALIEFGNEFFERFPYVTNAYNVRMYVEAMNIYGIKGLPQAVPVQFLEIENGFILQPYGVALTGNVFQPIATVLPVGTVYRSYFQTNEFAMPEPDFEAATFYRSEAYGGQGLLFPLMLLNLAPANLRFGWYVRNWVQAELPDGTFTEPVTAIWQNKPVWLYNFVPQSAVQYEDNSIILEIENDFPAGTIMRCGYQVQNGSFPEPDFMESQGFGDYDLKLDGTVNLGTVLFEEPYNLNPADKIIVWFRPRFDNNDIDTAMYLEVESVTPLFNAVTAGVITITHLDTSTSTYNVLDNATVVPYLAGETFVWEIFFNNWNTGDGIPDQAAVIGTIVGLGDLPIETLLGQAGVWNGPTKSIIFNTPVAASDSSYTWLINDQVVPVLP